MDINALKERVLDFVKTRKQTLRAIGQPLLGMVLQAV
jgi:hypothetical protein